MARNFFFIPILDEALVYERAVTGEAGGASFTQEGL
jgi:hypothetical protein